MAHTKIEYSKVAEPVVFGGYSFHVQRLDMFKFLMICMVVLTIVAVFHVWSRFKLIDINLQMTEVNRQFKQSQEEQKRLKLEVATLRTPARIEAIAKDELGMALPTEQQVIVVK